MHTYEKLDVPFEERPKLDAWPMTGVADIVRYAATSEEIGVTTALSVWHLDDRDLVVCGYWARSDSSLAEWADDSFPLVRSRIEGEANGDCGSRWVIVDSRQCRADGWFHRPRPTESDAEQFLRVRRAMEDIGVELVDAVIFDDDAHYWSMRELTLGTTDW